MRRTLGAAGDGSGYIEKRGRREQIVRRREGGRGAMAHEDEDEMDELFERLGVRAGRFVLSR